MSPMFNLDSKHALLNLDLFTRNRVGAEWPPAPVAGDDISSRHSLFSQLSALFQVQSIPLFETSSSSLYVDPDTLGQAASPKQYLRLKRSTVPIVLSHLSFPFPSLIATYADPSAAKGELAILNPMSLWPVPQRYSAWRRARACQ